MRLSFQTMDQMEPTRHSTARCADSRDPTHPDGDQRGGVEGREQHGVAKHQDEADGERYLR